MRSFRLGVVLSFVLIPATAILADTPVIDCSKKSLADALRDLSAKNLTINFTGVCAGPIVLATDGVTLQGVGTAIIDGGGADAITIKGASNVSLNDLEVTNGLTAITVRNGSHVAFTGVAVHDNSLNGILLQSASTALLTDVSVTHNGRTGVSADDGVGVTMRSSTITDNTVKDIQLTFGSRADLTQLTFGTYTCDATVLVRGTSGITCPH